MQSMNSISIKDKDSEFCKIIFRPTCSFCGNVLQNSIVDAHGTTSFVTPNICSYCGKYFDRIIMPTKLPYDDAVMMQEIGG